MVIIPSDSYYNIKTFFPSFVSNNNKCENIVVYVINNQ